MSPDDMVAIKKIYLMKNRNDNKALPILCSSINQVDEATYINKKAKELMEKYWPGALTIVLNKKEGMFDNICENTLAFRMPDSIVALKILDHFGPLATTSVNTSGEKEMNDVDEIAFKFGDFLDYIITDKVSFSSVASTVCKVEGEDISILRQGNIIIK